MRHTWIVPFLLLASWLIQGCELPEGPPDVAFETVARTPLLLDKTFVLLGPQPGAEAFIDTTRGGLDTLFQAGAENVISVVAEQSLSDLIKSDTLIRFLLRRAMPEPFTVTARVSDLAEASMNIIEQLSLSHRIDMGTIEAEARDLGTTALSIDTRTRDPIRGDTTTSLGPLDVSISTSFSIPATEWYAGIQDNQAVNAISEQVFTASFSPDIPVDTHRYLEELHIRDGSLTLTLTNRLGWTVNLSRIEIRNPDNAIVAFSSQPLNLSAGASASVSLSLQHGAIFHRSLSFHLFTSWPEQIASNPQHLQLDLQGHLQASALSFTVHEQSAPFILTLTEPFTLGPGFTTVAMTSTTGADRNRLFIELTNNLPFTLEDGNGQGPRLQLFSDSHLLNPRDNRFPTPIPPGGTARLEVDMAGQYLRNRLTYRLEAALPESTTPYQLRTDDGLHLSMTSTELEIKEARAHVSPLNPDPQSPFIDISNLMASAHLSQHADGVNQLFIELTNNLTVPLTDGSLMPGTPPRVLIRARGQTEPLAAVTFERSPGPGETVRGSANLAGKRITPELEYLFDIGTPVGLEAVLDRIENVSVHVFTTPLEFTQVRAVVPPQQGISVTSEDVPISEDPQIAGALITSANLQLEVTNRLPVPLSMELIIRNREAVDTYPADYEIVHLKDIVVDPHQSTSLPVRLRQVPLAAHTNALLLISTPGSNGNMVEISDRDKVEIKATGLAHIQRVYFYSSGESFQTHGSMALDAEDITFGHDDFIALSEGELGIENITSTLDFSIDTLQISFPNIRRAPFGPSDSLVIQFIQGAQNQPERYTFTGIPPRASGLSYQIPLTGLRVYPAGNTLAYTIRGRLDASQQVGSIGFTDSLMATVTIRNVDLQEVRVGAPHLVANLTPDRNGDGSLDVTTEAEVVSIDGLQDLHRRMQGLQVNGTVFSLHLTTNIVGNVTLYLALQGIGTDGQPLFLEGEGRFAVSPGDTMVENFRYQGTPLAPEHLLRLQLPGATSPDQPVTRTFMLTSSNSNIDAFLSALPSKIHLMGRVLIQGPVHLRKPLHLEATAGLTVPLHLMSPTLEIIDTLDIQASDLSSLPTDNADNLQIEEATLSLAYENHIPLQGEVLIEILDEHNQSTGIHVPRDGPLTIASAPADYKGFSTGFKAGEQTITLNRELLSQLKRGRKARVYLRLKTPAHAEEAHLRASDAIRLRLRARTRLIVRANS